MKIPDTVMMTKDDYWVMQDSWKIEWEKGVQVNSLFSAIEYKSEKCQVRLSILR